MWHRGAPGGSESIHHITSAWAGSLRDKRRSKGDLTRRVAVWFAGVERRRDAATEFASQSAASEGDGLLQRLAAKKWEDRVPHLLRLAMVSRLSRFTCGGRQDGIPPAAIRLPPRPRSKDQLANASPTSFR
jgi:hypothetical protein